MKKFWLFNVLFFFSSTVFADGAIRLALPADTVSLETRNVRCNELNLDRATFLVREASSTDEEVRVQFRKIRDDYDIVYAVYQLKLEEDVWNKDGRSWGKDERLENDFSGSYNIVFLSKRNDTCTLDFFSGAKVDYEYHMIAGLSDNGDLGIGGDSGGEKKVYGILKRLQE